MRNLEQDIIITDVDMERLQPVLQTHTTAVSEALEAELYRAVVVAQRSVPPDIVTMNSEVVYEDLSSGALRTITVVYPKDADATRGHVSVLAPIGSALLGMRVGQTIEWAVPGGTKRIRVAELRYQPEASGDFDR